jgi:hypothetical protein
MSLLKMTYYICYNPAIDTSQVDQGDVNTGKRNAYDDPIYTP